MENILIGIVMGSRSDWETMQGAAETLDELQKNLKEVIELCLEEYGDELPDLPHFVELQQIEVAV